MCASRADNQDEPTPARRVIVTPPPVARSARRTAEQQVLTTTQSADAFATPSENPATEGQVLAGPEPAIFGGVNPAGAGPTSLLPAVPADVTPPEHLEEDEVTAGPIIRASARTIIHFILHSLPTLAVLLVLALTFGTWAIVEAIPAQSYVHVTIHLRSNSVPTPEEAAPQQAEINNTLRTYPLRAAARSILAKNSPQLSPGFLDNMMFTGSDAITWTDASALRLRVDTARPEADAARLAAVAEAFMQLSQSRNRALQDHVANVENYRVHLRELRRQQQQNNEDLGQLPGTNPATSSDFARALERRIEATQKDIDAGQRLAETWISADRIDPAGVQRYDNRPVRRSALLGLWAAVLLLLGLPIVLNLAQRRRARQRHRRPQSASIVRQTPRK